MIVFFPTCVFASELFDYWNTGDDDADGFSGNNWKAQTFTTTDTYTIDYVQLKIYRSGTPGTLTIDLYDVDVAEKPDNLLCTGTINGDTLSESPEFVQINLVDCPELENATMYSLVAYCPSNYVIWRFDSSTGYADGDFWYSADAGVNWTSNGNNDFMFEIYGTETGGETGTTSTSTAEDFQANSVFFGLGFIIFLTALYGSISWITKWS